jgi:hypothetical protein
VVNTTKRTNLENVLFVNIWKVAFPQFFWGQLFVPQQQKG